MFLAGKNPLLGLYPNEPLLHFLQAYYLIIRGEGEEAQRYVETARSLMMCAQYGQHLPVSDALQERVQAALYPAIEDDIEGKEA